MTSEKNDLEPKKRNIVGELEYRIQADIQAFQGFIPERHALAWNGYLAGIYEWGIISLQDYTFLCKLLPSITPPDPIETIFTGRE